MPLQSGLSCKDCALLLSNKKLKVQYLSTNYEKIRIYEWLYNNPFWYCNLPTKQALLRAGAKYGYAPASFVNS